MHLTKNPHLRYKIKSQHQKDKIDILVSLKLYWKLWKEANNTKNFIQAREYMRTIKYYQNQLDNLKSKFKKSKKRKRRK